MVTASLQNYRQSPRKVRLVANLIKGKSVNHALQALQFLSKKAKHPLMGLIESAIANAKNNFSLEQDSLFIKELRVDQGYVLKRSMPRARGSAYPIKKRTSHVKLVLAVQEKVGKVKKLKAKKPEAKS